MSKMREKSYNFQAPPAEFNHLFAFKQTKRCDCDDFLYIFMLRIRTISMRTSLSWANVFLGTDYSRAKILGEIKFFVYLKFLKNNSLPDFRRFSEVTVNFLCNIIPVWETLKPALSALTSACTCWSLTLGLYQRSTIIPPLTNLHCQPWPLLPAYPC